MALYDIGNPPIKSTQASAANPSTSAIVAEILSSQFGGNFASRAHSVRVTWWVGGSTLSSYWLEHCLSSGLGSTAIRDRLTVWAPTNQTAQYVSNYRFEAGDRLRIRVGAALVAATIDGKIEAEPLG